MGGAIALLCVASHNKGKVERFNRIVDSFLSEIALEKSRIH